METSSIAVFFLNCPPASMGSTNRKPLYFVSDEVEKQIVLQQKGESTSTLTLLEILLLVIAAENQDPWVKPNLPPIKSDKTQDVKKNEEKKDEKETGNKDLESGGMADIGTERESFASKMLKSVFCLM